jgi:hypothetical protein
MRAWIRDQLTTAALRRSADVQILNMRGKRSNVVLDPRLMALFQPNLAWRPDLFAAGLETTTPVRVNDNLYFGSGCRLHLCGMAEVAWVIDRRRRSGSAMFMDRYYDPGVAPPHPEFHYFGPCDEPMPEPLRAWASARGMNGKNLYIIRDPIKTNFRTPRASWPPCKLSGLNPLD